MTSEKVLEVIDLYRKKFVEMKIEKADFPHEELAGFFQATLQHCHGMLDKMEKFIDEKRIEKSMRWLGFIQGALWVQRVYTLKELVDHSRL